MDEEKINKDQTPPNKPNEIPKVVVVDHILIVDNETGQQIINKRG